MMMVRLKRSGLVWALLCCLVLVNAFMAAPSVAHAAHHATHKAGSHSTGLCAWLCAAGQGIETSAVRPGSTFQPVGHVVSCHVEQSEREFSTHIFLRGPPALSE